VTYTVEVELALTVEVLDAMRGAPATREAPPEPEYVCLSVRLGALEVTDYLPPDVLDVLEADALERLEAAGAEP